MGEPVDFRHRSPEFRTYAGTEALEQLPREVDRAGSERVVVLHGRSMGTHQHVLDRLETTLGPRLAGWFTDVVEHSPIPVVDRVVDELRRLDADGVIALGGGSAIVTARAATILLAEGRSAHELCTRRGDDGRLHSPKLQQDKAPIWIVPSTPTTAYAKAGSAVRDPETGDRLALFDPKTRARGLFLDGDVALTAPATLARSSALNALSMSVESIQANTGDPLADASLAGALRLLAAGMRQLRERPEDADVRLQLMAGALLAGQGSDHVGGGLAQGLSHAAGPRSSVANGVVEALLLPHALRHNAPAAVGRLALAGEVLSQATAPAATVDDRTIQAIEQLLDDLAVPRRLRDVGLQQAALDEVAAHAVDDWALSSISRPATQAELERLLADAW